MGCVGCRPLTASRHLLNDSACSDVSAITMQTQWGWQPAMECHGSLRRAGKGARQAVYAWSQKRFVMSWPLSRDLEAMGDDANHSLEEEGSKQRISKCETVVPLFFCLFVCLFFSAPGMEPSLSWVLAWTAPLSHPNSNSWESLKDSRAHLYESKQMGPGSHSGGKLLGITLEGKGKQQWLDPV